MTISFGSFEGICQQAALIVCPLVETAQGVEPTCYSRNVQIGRTLIFQPGTILMDAFVVMDEPDPRARKLDSGMLRAYSCHYHDAHYDFPHSK